MWQHGMRGLGLFQQRIGQKGVFKSEPQKSDNSHRDWRIKSNDMKQGLVKKEGLGGENVVDDIVAAWAFADADPYRAATHNKGI